ncbi:hypothetical protein ACFW9X_33740, partial [Streptomyces sp. NPDC059466]
MGSRDGQGSGGPQSTALSFPFTVEEAVRMGLAPWAGAVVVVLSAGRVAAAGPPAEVCTGRLLSDVYRQPVEALARPRTGAVLVTPTARRRA